MKKNISDSKGFSVVMPAFNSEKTIKKAIDSVLSQEGVKVELIVIDNNSGDGTRKIVQKYKKKIRCFSRKERGVSGARNLGIRMAHYDLIAFLDSDDEWLPGKLSHQAFIFEKHPEVGLTATGVRCLDTEGELLRIISSAKTGWVLQDLLESNFLTTSSVAIRKKALRKKGEPFRTGLSYGEDYFLWVQLAVEFPFWITPEVFVNYTESSDRRFAEKYSNEDIQSLYQVLERTVGEKAGESGLRKLHSKMHLELGLLARRQKERRKTLAESFAAIRSNPGLSWVHQKQILRNMFFSLTGR